MEKVVRILMNRDGYSEDEARAMVDECMQMMLRNPMEATDIIQEYLYLEPDYIETLFCI